MNGLSWLRRDATVPALIGLVSLTAWILLWQLGQSPSGGGVHDHGAAGHDAMTAASATTLGTSFVLSWIVMTGAMMLPTTIPLLQIFRRLTLSRHDGMALLLLVVLGYVAAWAACGVVVFAAARAIQSVARGSAWLVANPQYPAAALLLVAGAFQFSALKYRCLDKCRSPLSFVTSRWRGSRERWHSFKLGVEHGAFCVGCCWALMLLMFVSGTASLLWMVALGGVMAIEKNAPWGRRLSTPLGVVLIAASAAVLFA